MKTNNFEIIKSKKITKENTTYKLSENYNLNIIKENSKIVSQTLLTNIKSVENDCRLSVLYLKDKNLFNELIKTKTFVDLFYTDKGFYKDLFEIKDYFKYFTENGFDETNVILANYSGHMVFDYKNTPISTAYYFDYIGGLNQKIRNDEYYKTIIEKLKKSKYTIELKESEIPYYNSNFSGQIGVSSWTVRIDQDVYEKLFDEICSKMKKSDHISVNLKDMIYGIKVWILSDLDIYGINKDVLDWKEVKNEDDDDDDDDEF